MFFFAKLKSIQEFLHRPTAPAAWWATPNEHVLGGRDLLRSVQGTWLGVTRKGRIAVLTNFREDGKAVQEEKSRGAIVSEFLAQPANSTGSITDFVRHLIEGQKLEGVGGFSLICGQLGQPLAVVSNRATNIEDVRYIAEHRGETTGLSNTTWDDRTWRKVLEGEELLRNTIASSVAQNNSKAEFIDDLMRLLNVDTLPRKSRGEDLASYISELRNSIFVPLIGEKLSDEANSKEVSSAKSHQRVEVNQDNYASEHHDGLSGVYGTQTQTVVLVDHKGILTFVERRLYDSNAKATSTAEKDRIFEFNIKS